MGEGDGGGGLLSQQRKPGILVNLHFVFRLSLKRRVGFRVGASEARGGLQTEGDWRRDDAEEINNQHPSI